MKRPTLTTIVGLLLVLAVVVAAQALVGTFHVRRDLTRQQLYTISPLSKRTLRQMDDLLKVNVYLSDKLPPQLSNIRRDIEDLLTEFRVYSNGRVRFTFQDPGKNETLKEKAREEGVAEAPFTVLDQDQQTTIYGFMGLSMKYQDRAEAIPVFNEQILQNMEYELTSRLLKMLRKETPVVGFTAGHGELNFQQTRTIRMRLEEQYTVQDVDLVKDGRIGQDVRTLIIAGPTSPFTEKDLDLLDQFMLGGGNVVALVDVVDQSRQSATPGRAQHGLDTWLAHLGVRLTGNLVGDFSSPVVPVQQPFGMAMMQYPLFVKITPQGVNRDVRSIATVGPGMVLPWPGELTLGDAPNGVKVTELLRSSPQSWTMPEPFQMQPGRELLSRQPDGKAKPLAVLLAGKIPPLYPGAPPAGVPAGQNRLNQPRKATQVLVVAASRWLDDTLGAVREPANLGFFLSTIDALTLDPGLSDIRVRSLGAERIDMGKLETRTGDPASPKVDSKVPGMKLLYTLLMPLLITVAAVVKFLLTVKGRKAFEEASGA